VIHLQSSQNCFAQQHCRPKPQYQLPITKPAKPNISPIITRDRFDAFVFSILQTDEDRRISEVRHEIQIGKMDKGDSFLFDTNRTKIKRVFAHHASGGEMSMNELFSFCKNAKVFPDILTAFELKRLVAKITG
jgi:hypothetical protein